MLQSFWPILHEQGLSKLPTYCFDFKTGQRDNNPFFRKALQQMHATAWLQKIWASVLSHLGEISLSLHVLWKCSALHAEHALHSKGEWRPSSSTCFSNFWKKSVAHRDGTWFLTGTGHPQSVPTRPRFSYKAGRRSHCPHLCKAKQD